MQHTQFVSYQKVQNECYCKYRNVNHDSNTILIRSCSKKRCVLMWANYDINMIINSTVTLWEDRYWIKKVWQSFIVDPWQHTNSCYNNMYRVEYRILPRRHECKVRYKLYTSRMWDLVHVVPLLDYSRFTSVWSPQQWWLMATIFIPKHIFIFSI